MIQVSVGQRTEPPFFHSLLSPSPSRLSLPLLLSLLHNYVYNLSLSFPCFSILEMLLTKILLISLFWLYKRRMYEGKEEDGR